MVALREELRKIGRFFWFVIDKNEVTVYSVGMSMGGIDLLWKL